MARIFITLLLVLFLVCGIISFALFISNQVKGHTGSAVATNTITVNTQPVPTATPALVPCFDGSYQPITRGCGDGRELVTVSPNVSTPTRQPVATTVTNTPTVSTATPLPVPTATPIPTGTPVPTDTPAPQPVQQVGFTQCKYKEACSFPQPAQQGQILVAVGDINNSGRCHYRVFEPGQAVNSQLLGVGTYNIFRLAGPHDAMIKQADFIGMQGASTDPNGACPKL